MKALLSIGIPVAVAALLSGAAGAAEIPYAVGVGLNEQLTGTVYLDDSSGDVESASGVASGVVNGKYTLDGSNRHAELRGTGLKLNVNFDRGSQQLNARLDTCPASPDSCSSGDPVILWEK